MVLYYDKNNAWTIPNNTIFEILLYMKNDNKKYFTIKKIAQIVYTLSKVDVNWDDKNYINFIGELPLELGNKYKTVYTSSKYHDIKVSKENCERLKLDLIYLKNMLSEIMSSMILDNKRKLKWEGVKNEV